jgi:hypothetical protein
MPDGEVLNFGVHGYGQDQMLVYLREEGIRYRPDVVILGYVWFDRDRNRYAFTNFAKPAFELDDGQLRLTNTPVPTPEAVMAAEPYRSKLVDLLRIVGHTMLVRSGVTERRSRELESAIIGEMGRVARQNGAEPVVVYLPVLAELLDARSEMSDNERILDGICTKHSIRCIFLRQDLVSALPPGVTIDTRRHWPAFVHEIAAAKIHAYLAREGLLNSR